MSKQDIRLFIVNMTEREVVKKNIDMTDCFTNKYHTLNL